MSIKYNLHPIVQDDPADIPLNSEPKQTKYTNTIMTKTNAAFWREMHDLGITPRYLRTRNPDTLALDAARALSVHAWLTAPPDWKPRVLRRLAELETREREYEAALKAALRV